VVARRHLYVLPSGTAFDGTYDVMLKLSFRRTLGGSFERARILVPFTSDGPQRKLWCPGSASNRMDDDGRRRHARILSTTLNCRVQAGFLDESGGNEDTDISRHSEEEGGRRC
jgi:hypothetical protein